MLDIRAATMHAMMYAFPKYDREKCGKCALFVRRALDAGGMTGFSGHAHTYVNNLPKRGWKPVSYGANDTPRLGDIAVFGATPALKYGHIQIWCGAAWVSDYVQRGTGPNGGIYPSNAWRQSALTVWRYPA